MEFVSFQKINLIVGWQYLHNHGRGSFSFIFNLFVFFAFGSEFWVSIQSLHGFGKILVAAPLGCIAGSSITPVARNVLALWIRTDHIP